MIFIPSYKRAARLGKTINTLQFLSAEWRLRTTLVVREDEEEAYLPIAKTYGVGLHAIPRACYDGKDFFGWGDTMDYIVDLGSRNHERFVIMDDDLKLAYRPSLEVRKWEPMTADTFNLAMDCLMTTSWETPYMGLRERQFSDQRKNEHDDGTRFIHVFSFYGPFFRARTDFRYRNTEQRFMTDLKMLLSLLVAGINTRTWNRFVHDDIPDAEGGCSTMRTIEGYNESAIQLYKQFPEFVTLRQKTNWGDVRIGTTIAWAKARDYGRRVGLPTNDDEQ